MILPRGVGRGGRPARHAHCEHPGVRGVGTLHRHRFSLMNAQGSFEVFVRPFRRRGPWHLTNRRRIGVSNNELLFTTDDQIADRGTLRRQGLYDARGPWSPMRYATRAPREMNLTRRQRASSRPRRGATTCQVVFVHFFDELRRLLPPAGSTPSLATPLRPLAGSFGTLAAKGRCALASRLRPCDRRVDV
jgi:hypothetical protein